MKLLTGTPDEVGLAQACVASSTEVLELFEAHWPEVERRVPGHFVVAHSGDRLPGADGCDHPPPCGGRAVGYAT